MIFQAAITIPKNTTEPAPVVVMLPIAKGIISKIMIRPRPGHAGLAHLVIRHHEHQIAPSSPNMDFHGDTFPIDWEEFHESDQPPFELKLVGWNDDDTYSHTFDVYVVVLPKDAVLSVSVVESIKNLFGILSPKRILWGKS